MFLLRHFCCSIPPSESAAAMDRVHSHARCSFTTTTEPLAALPPPCLFPFLQVLPSTSTSPQPIIPTTVHTSDISCPCSPDCSPPVFTSHSFMTLPSANSHQPVVVPLPQILFTVPSTATGDRLPSQLGSSERPFLVWSQGSTTVDTCLGSRGCVQHSIYSWYLLCNCTIQYCWNLPEAPFFSTEPQSTGQSTDMQISVVNTKSRVCQGDEVRRCPGHQWEDLVYHMQVKQWQQETMTNDNTHSCSDVNSGQQADPGMASPL